MKCPRCGSEDIVPIVYGYPGPELVKESEAGKVRLGGCIVSEDNPTHACKRCGHRWRRDSR